MQRRAIIEKKQFQEKNFKKQLIDNLDIRLFYEQSLNRKLGKPNDEGFVQTLCPFHDDKVESFSVNDKDNYWHCFGCGKGGSIIDFFMLWHDCDFTTALWELASWLL